MEKYPPYMNISEIQPSEDVEEAVKKQERLTEERVPNNPNDRIEAYMDRLENIFLNKNKDVRERNVELLRENTYDAFIIKLENVPVIFGCTLKEIAQKPEEVDENTKVYIGPLFPGVFKLNLEHLYTAFPEGKIQRYETTIGGKTKDELVSELQEKDIYISDWAKDLLNSKDFETSKSTEELDLISLTVADLGFEDGATTDEIYVKAQEFGLELCPAEVGPHLSLSTDTTDMYIAAKQITDLSGRPSVFDLGRDGAKVKLSAGSAEPSDWWSAGFRFVFSLRKNA